MWERLQYRRKRAIRRPIVMILDWEQAKELLVGLDDAVKLLVAAELDKSDRQWQERARWSLKRLVRLRVALWRKLEADDDSE